MKDLVEYVAKNLVHNPEAVVVTESGPFARRVLNLKVAPDDMGRIIGKEGRIAQALRVLLKVSAGNQGGRGGQPMLIIGSTEDGEGTLVAEDETADIPEDDAEER